MDMDTTESFFLAIERGDIDAVKEFLSAGSDVNLGHPEDDLKPLHMAVKSNQLDMCKLLVAYGADVNAHDKDDGFTAMHWASQSHVQNDIMNFLLEHNADPNAKTFGNRTPLHEILFKYNPGKLFKLFAAGVEESLNIKDHYFGETPLFCAVRFIHNDLYHQSKDVALPCITVVKELIKRGADIHLINNRLESLLHKAVANSCYETIAFIMKRGCDINHIDKDGDTPLHKLVGVYCQNQREGTSMGLCNLGLTNELEVLDIQTDNQSITDKNLSEYKKSLFKKTMSLFVDYGVKIDMITRQGNTPLHTTCSAIKPSLFTKKCLLDLGADINAKNIEGKTPLHLTCAHTATTFNIPNEEEAKESIDFLLRSGADMNAVDVCGWTPLDYAVSAGNTVATKILLESGININTSDICNRTALHNAVIAEDTNLLDLLLDYGADIEATDMYGATPLYYAVYFEFLESINKLLERGADINHHDSSGKTVWDMAIYFEAIDIVETLDNFLAKISMSQEEEDEEEEEEGKEEEEEEEVVLFIEDVHQWIDDKEWENDIKSMICDFIEKPPILETEEYALLKNQVTIFMQRLSTAVKKLDSRLSFTPVMSGSVSEGTKVTTPDEFDFDFLLSLDNFTENVVVQEDYNIPSGYCKVLLKDTCLDNQIATFFDNGILSADKLCPVLYGAVCTALSETEIWSDLGLFWNCGPHNSSAKISTVNFKWVGPMFKGLSVSVDLVPAVTLNKWWPSSINKAIITQHMKDLGCLIELKPQPSLNITESVKILRISFSKIETRIFETLPSVVRKGYMLAKAIQDCCPALFMDEYEDVKLRVNNVLSTYNLKTALFEELENGAIQVTNMTFEEGARAVAYRIWQRIHEAVCEGVMTSFFVNELKIYDVSLMDEIKIKHAEAFSKIIMNFLAQN